MNLTQPETNRNDASLIVLSAFTYAYDGVGNRNGVHEQNGDRLTWSFDEANQLTWEQRSGANSYDMTHTYDEVIIPGTPY